MKIETKYSIGDVLLDRHEDPFRVVEIKIANDGNVIYISAGKVCYEYEKHIMGKMVLESVA